MALTVLLSIPIGKHTSSSMADTLPKSFCNPGYDPNPLALFQIVIFADYLPSPAFKKANLTKDPAFFQQN